LQHGESAVSLDIKLFRDITPNPVNLNFPGTLKVFQPVNGYSIVVQAKSLV